MAQKIRMTYMGFQKLKYCINGICAIHVCQIKKNCQCFFFSLIKARIKYLYAFFTVFKTRINFSAEIFELYVLVMQINTNNVYLYILLCVPMSN